MLILYSYRSRDEVKQIRETRDPIVTFKNKILEANLVTEDEIKVIIRSDDFE